MSGAADNRPLVAVSACLLGEPVRYDGRHKLCTVLQDFLRRHFRLLPLCPEVAIGLGVPRPPIQLVHEENGIRVLGVDCPQLDVTEALAGRARWLLDAHPELAGHVLMQKSPSCALHSGQLFDRNDRLLDEQQAGGYARILRKLAPCLPLAEARQLQAPAEQQRFLRQVLHYYAGLGNR